MQANESAQLHQLLYKKHEVYRENAIRTSRFKHKEIVPLIKRHTENQWYEIHQIGKSVKEKDIYVIKAGSGPVKVLLWSQIHGDEPTATMAILDIFNFLSKNDELNDFRSQLLQGLTLYFVPMLNPDGADEIIRRNAIEIDLNRDALRKVSPESQLLTSLYETIKPDFAFNLHDQEIYYNAESKPATFSVLAPAFDNKNTISKTRERAMQLIVDINEVLQDFVPGHVAKYSNRHDPRCFGDAVQKAGISTILLETGGYKNDSQRQYTRKLNFVAILMGLNSIVTKSYEEKNTEQYNAIPESRKHMFDLLIRNVFVERNGKNYIYDIGIKRELVDIDALDMQYYSGNIANLGDLLTYYGYEEVDAEGLKAIPGMVFPYVIKDISELNEAYILSMLEMGYTTVRVKHLPLGRDFSQLPINLISTNKNQDNNIVLGAKPNFILARNEVAYYAVINGTLFDLKNDESFSNSGK